MKTIDELRKLYDALIAKRFSRGWSWTGGSTACCSHRDEPEILRRLMLAETTLALQTMDRQVESARKQVDEVRNAGHDTWWICDPHEDGMPTLAQRADGKPASRRYAKTLAEIRHRRRANQTHALAIAKRALANTEAERQRVHDLLYDLFGIPGIHCPTYAEIWPKDFGFDHEESMASEAIAEAREIELLDDPRCSDCGGPGPLVVTAGGARVCRDCWMGENWKD